MSKDNLLFFPKKSTSIIGMTENEVKWSIVGSLALILALSLGLNSAIFQQEMAGEEPQAGRRLASISPIFSISWEKKAKDVLETANPRDLASIGRNPSPFDKLSFGLLEGKYAIMLKQGKVSQIEFANKGEDRPKFVNNRENFIAQYRNLIAPDSSQITKIYEEANGQVQLERYKLIGAKGQDLGLVQFVLDDQERLISMTVNK